MSAALALGAVFGAALVAACRLWRPPPEPLAAALARLSTPTASAAPSPTPPGLTARVGEAVRSAGVEAAAAPPCDLRITGRSREAHMGAKTLLALAGGAVSLTAATSAAAAGAAVPLASAAVLALASAAGGFVLPDLRLKAQAADRRRDALAALGGFLDLVVIGLAGGCGVEGALREACAVGSGWAFAELRGAVEGARLSGRSPWSALRRLGDDLGLPALGEVAASVSLAGTEGARVKASLAAKADALRVRQLADAEADAQAATERLAIPTVLMLAGFIILIAYPALDAVLTGL